MLWLDDGWVEQDEKLMIDPVFFKLSREVKPLRIMNPV